jgi:hypothetical protein
MLEEVGYKSLSPTASSRQVQLMNTYDVALTES